MLKRKGFTLIELQVVIAIVALLLSVVMPGLQKNKEVSKSVVCTSNLTQRNICLSFYASENTGTFPSADWNDDESAAQSV
jgi:prepilin-type N-terminal cleavage/methylation domain-containing protein